MKQKEERSGISQSFVMGAIALVFLIVGYQTALFIYNASLTRIAANRDMPDTVYVYREVVRSSDGPVEPVMQENHESAQRKNSYHSQRASAVRRNMPFRQVESFRFNPNTVSVEDLCRLGFSPKQAESIDNYRRKGGRFRRKADFAKSYVVSDSIYRRLESFIDIPLVDLNTADSAAFDALPGIGGWFASKMLEYREKLGAYSYKEQLLDIHNFDQEKYDALSDLITVSPEYIMPYPLWTLPADSLRKHPYIGDYAAKGIVLYRDNNPPSSWTVEALITAGILNPETSHKLARCVISEP
jgi:DNA uptake protein ComE-like DNA-binding protein